MNEEEIKAHNDKIKIIIQVKEEEVNILQTDIGKLRIQLKAPCKYCAFDGVYRCEVCMEDNYEGFNVKDYPNMVH